MFTFWCPSLLFIKAERNSSRCQTVPQAFTSSQHIKLRRSCDRAPSIQPNSPCTPWRPWLRWRVSLRIIRSSCFRGARGRQERVCVLQVWTLAFAGSYPSVPWVFPSHWCTRFRCHLWSFFCSVCVCVCTCTCLVDDSALCVAQMYSGDGWAGSVQK